MASPFDAAIEAHRRGERVGRAAFFELDAVQRVLRLWNGKGVCDALDHEWQGAGDLISVASITQKTDTDYASADITLSNVPGSIANDLDRLPDQVTGRAFRMYVGHIGYDAPWYGALIHEPVLIRFMEMDQLTIADQGMGRSRLTISIINWASARRRKPNDLFTSTDQRARSPGNGTTTGPDSAFDWSAGLPGKVVSIFT